MAKILVVDDQADNRELVVTLIHYRGHQALEADDGFDALTIVRAEQPDLVISDILMPTMDGYEFVRQLRTDPAIANTEVIFYSAHYREREARNLAKECGVARVLIKPCEPQDILLAIDQALAHASAPVTPPDAQEFDREHLRLMTDKLSGKVAELEAVNRRLDALTDFNLQLASERNPRLLLEKVCRGARDLIGATYAVVCVTSKVNGDLIFFTSGIESELAGTLNCPVVDCGPLGAVLAERRARRMSIPDGDPTVLGLPPGYPQVHTSLMAPVMSLSHTYGWICLADKLGAQQFSEEDERILSILAAQVGRIYENSILYAEVQRYAGQLQREMVERRRATDELRTSEAGLNHAQLLAKLTHVITGPQGVFESWPATMPLMIGLDAEHMVKNTVEWLKMVHPNDQAHYHSKVMEVRGRGVRTDFEYRLQRTDGVWLHIRQVMEPLHGDSGADGNTRWFNTIQDITDLKETEKKIKRLNRVYAVLSGINVLIVRVRNREELFREACRIAVDQGQFKMAWIGFVDQEAMTIVPITFAGADSEFLAVINDNLSLRDEVTPPNSLIGHAIREKKAMVSNDLRNDPISLSIRDRIGRGILSMAFLPLIVADTSVGILALYADEAGFFDDAEMKLLTELAGDIGFALDHIEKDERLNYLAYYDEITGLPNQTLFMERVGHLCTHATGKRMLAVAVLDIDRFRIINDTFDRLAGDELLKLVAQRIEQSSIGFDTVARIGINSFGVALREPRDAGSVALSLDQLLHDCFDKPYFLRDTELRIAGKAGITLCPLDGTDAATLFRNAEAALKRAKRSGESVLFYTSEMNTRVAEALSMESRLRTALALNQFVLHYQPKVDLATGKLTSLEALIRWNDPQSGMVWPVHFIPMLEETGLIYEVGRWALRKALDDNRRWRAAGLRNVRVAVNVSPLQLRHRNFIDDVKQVIGGDPQVAAGLELEITESLIMEDVEHSIASLQEIRALGVTIAIDDFGTGFSSLSYLAKLPVDRLKIDRSFVIELTTGPQGLALVSTIINLAHALGLKVVAEGVDSDEQVRLLRLLGCDEMQGFLFSKPLPSEVLESRHLTLT